MRKTTSIPLNHHQSSTNPRPQEKDANAAVVSSRAQPFTTSCIRQIGRYQHYLQSLLSLGTEGKHIRCKPLSSSLPIPKMSNRHTIAGAQAPDSRPYGELLLTRARMPYARKTRPDQMYVPLSSWLMDSTDDFFSEND